MKSVSPLDALLSAGALFLAVLTIGAITLLVMKLAEPTSGYEGRTITVSATGDAYQTPDIAEFSYTVRSEGKEVSETQTEVTNSSNAIIEKLKAIGVDSKNIQTQSITANPRYEWQRKASICPADTYCPPEGKNVLVGYESAITTVVKVDDFSLTGNILALLGESNVDNISGPNFMTEDPDQAMSEARNEALARAREKAQSMSKAMGVKLGKVVSFSENRGGYYDDYARMETMAVGAYDAVAPKALPAPTIEAGQDKVTVTVDVIYRIK